MTARTSAHDPFSFVAPFVGRAAPILAAVALSACASGGSSDASPTGTSGEAVSSSATNASLALIRQIEDHRLLGDPRLKAFLASTTPSVAAAAAVSAGRIGDPSLEASVITLLDATSAEVRGAAALSLSLLGGTAAESAIDTRLGKEHDVTVRQALLLALGQVGTATSLPLVTAALATNQPEVVQTAAAEALGTLLAGGVAPGSDPAIVTELLAYAAEAPELRAVAAAYALSKLSAARVVLPEAGLTKAFAFSPAPSARAFVAAPLATLGTTTAIATLATGAAGDTSPRVRSSACSALASVGTVPAALAALSAALHDPSSEVEVAAATAIGGLGASASSLLPALGSTYDTSLSAWVRSTALTALVAVDPGSARPRVEAGLTDAWPVQLSAIAALPVLGTAADLSSLLALAAKPDTRLASAAIEAITQMSPSLITPAVKTAMLGALGEKDWEITASVADVAVAFGWTDFAADLDAAYDDFPGEQAMNGRLEIVYALGTIGSAADLPVLERGILDDEVIVSEYAAQSYQQITGTDVSNQVRLENVVTTPTPSPAEVDAAVRSAVLLETTRGPIVLQMLPEAPLNATNFVHLAESGFYDGLPFHRVLPNFVAQGGDPRGDGSGGSKNLVRDELSSVPHLAGTVGLATEGKDTGSSQFFFNEGWNVHLDFRYTVFAQVVYGLDAAERLEVGDTILSAEVIPGWALTQSTTGE